MIRVSSNLTLLLKIFIPTFWFVFFTSFLVGILFIDRGDIPLFSSWGFRAIYIGLYISFGLFLYFTVMQLQRVEFGQQKFHVSNYFHTYAYVYPDIKNIDEKHFGLFRLVTITLKSKGSLGRKIRFIPTYASYIDFIKNNPLLFAHLL